MPWLHIAVALVALAVAVMVAVKIYERRKAAAVERAKTEKKARQLAKFIDLLDRAEQGDQQAQDQLVWDEWSTTDPGRSKRLEAIKKQVSIRRNWRDHGQPQAELYAAWQAALGTQDEFTAHAAFVLRNYPMPDHRENQQRLKQEVPITKEAARELLNQRLQERYEQLVAEMMENRESFLELRELLSQYFDRDSLIQRAADFKLVYPDDWNHAVALHFANPSIGDFVRGRDPDPGELRLRAEEALDSGDIVELKLVLAYANSHYNPNRYLLELGDVLTEKLARAITDHHAARAQSTASGDSA